MRRSYSSEIFRNATEPYSDILPRNFDFEGWILNTRNVMYEEDGSVGLATFEYPGLYNIHWFFNCGGKYALRLAKEMIADLFETTDAQLVRGLTRVDLRAARIMCRKLGLKSHGIIKFADGEECEMFFLSKDEFKGLK